MQWPALCTRAATHTHLEQGCAVDALIAGLLMTRYLASYTSSYERVRVQACTSLYLVQAGVQVQACTKPCTSLYKALYKLVQGLGQALCELVQLYGALVQGPCMSSYETRTYYVLP